MTLIIHLFGNITHQRKVSVLILKIFTKVSAAAIILTFTDHLDYVVRYAPKKDADYQPADYTDLLDMILKKLIENGKGIEINTAGLRYGLKEANPCCFILKRYRELGGEILTTGSDAHKPRNMACF